MRVDLPLNFMDEYWSHSKSDRKLVIQRVFGLQLQEKSPTEILEILSQEDWSTGFIDWLMPNVEKFRSALEINAIPYVEDFDGEMNRYLAWQSRKQRLYRIAIYSFVGAIVCFGLTLVVLAMAVQGSEEATSSNASGNSAFILLMILRLASIVLGIVTIWKILEAKGRSPWGGILLSLLCGVGLLYSLLVSDLSRLERPVKSADHDERVRLRAMAQKAVDAESSSES